MQDVWEPIPGTRLYSRNGVGLYERLNDKLYLRIDEVDETDVRDLAVRFADANEARCPVRAVA
ncbi:MAG TPA: hypothetical protein VE690_06220 [Rhodopila sp.]|jgi:hypothetical protein|nr:hypothetical protein [Rhodopila sp.]